MDVHRGTGQQTTNYLYKNGTDGSLPSVTNFTICMWMSIPKLELLDMPQAIFSYANAGNVYFK